MQNQKKAGQAEDWELSEEYYKEDTGKKELRLEDFLEEEMAEETGSGWPDGRKQPYGAAGSGGCAGKTDPGTFRQRTPGRSDCLHAGYGRTADRDILVCIQSFPEDDPLAVARLICCLDSRNFLSRIP